MRTLLLAWLAFFTTGCLPPSLELVQSIPTETEGLSIPGIRDSQSVWVEMIREAKTSIDLGQFYVASKSGEALDPVLQALEEAGARGVQLRIILQKSMLQNDPQSYERLRAIPGAEVRPYDISKLTGGILHAKYWVIDREVAFIGSQNLDWRALSQIHETGLKIKNKELASQLASIFEIDWQMAQTGKIPPLGEAPRNPDPMLELTASPPEFNPAGIRSTLDAILELLKGAEQKVQIQLLNYSMGSEGKEWRVLDQVLRQTAQRGVQVMLLVSHWNTEKPGIQHLKDLSLVPQIEVKLATIPEAKSGFIPYARVIHSKFMTVDSKQSWLGTSNWSRGYFLASRNVDLILRNAKLTQQLETSFDKLWSSRYAERIDPKKDYPLPRKGE